MGGISVSSGTGGSMGSPSSGAASRCSACESSTILLLETFLRRFDDFGSMSETVERR